MLVSIGIFERNKKSKMNVIITTRATNNFDLFHTHN